MGRRSCGSRFVIRVGEGLGELRFFEDGIQANAGTTFSQVYRDRLITPRWRSGAHLSFPQRFSLPPGVKVTIPNYGEPASAPVYGPFYAALEAAGYTAGRDLVVAGL
jgi:hypothetical protein